MNTRIIVKPRRLTRRNDVEMRSVFFFFFANSRYNIIVSEHENTL